MGSATIPEANKGFNYTIAARPTLYAGVTFRSRLEATWAAFFDNMEWEWKYEPCYYSGWLPDFILFGNLAVEVKPIEGLDEFPDTEKLLRSDCPLTIVILGIEPLLEKHSMGWVLANRPRTWFNGTFGYDSYIPQFEDGLFCVDYDNGLSYGGASHMFPEFWNKALKTVGSRGMPL